MKITRTCPICNHKTSMQIDDWSVEHNNIHSMGIVEGRFYKNGDCKTCQDIIYHAIKEEDK